MPRLCRSNVAHAAFRCFLGASSLIQPPSSPSKDVASWPLQASVIPKSSLPLLRRRASRSRSVARLLIIIVLQRKKRRNSLCRPSTAVLHFSPPKRITHEWPVTPCSRLSPYERIHCAYL